MKIPSGTPRGMDLRLPITPLNIPRPPYTLIKPKGNAKGDRMKTAIIYYSYEGNTALAAKTIASAIKKPDVFEIKTVDQKKRTGFGKYLWGGGQVIRHVKPALKPLSVDVNTYDLVILGTPVWAGSPAPALVSFLAEKKISGKKIALFCCHRGGKRNVFIKLKKLLPGNTIIGEIDFIDPAHGSSEELGQKIGEWVKAIGA